MRVQRFYDEAAASRAAPCVRGVERQIRILLTRQQEQTQNTDKLERELTNLGNSHVPRSSQEMESFKLLSGGLAQVLRDVRKSLVAQRTELLELLVALRPRDGVSNAGKVYLPRQPAQVIRSLTSVSTLQAFAETALQDATQTVNFLQDQLISLNLGKTDMSSDNSTICQNCTIIIGFQYHCSNCIRALSVTVYCFLN
eukprot:GHVT01078958.1.p1 GENE.GHVT01078958.1~~GHVT01078958.1.p1  ORF type:complete len:198 (+),score=8.73 GHVT01078958.1:367-960(+)